MTAAPAFRSIDALTGNRPPTVFFDSLAQADKRIADEESAADELRRLRAENRDLSVHNADLRLDNEELFREVGRLRGRRTAGAVGASAADSPGSVCDPPTPPEPGPQTQK